MGRGREAPMVLQLHLCKDSSALVHEFLLVSVFPFTLPAVLPLEFPDLILLPP